MDWYLKAAKQSHLRACMEIGYLYQSGYGVPANEELAFQWFCKSKELSKGKFSQNSH
jgi:TPR repeat protein